MYVYIYIHIYIYIYISYKQTSLRRHCGRGLDGLGLGLQCGHGLRLLRGCGLLRAGYPIITIIIVVT